MDWSWVTRDTNREITTQDQQIFQTEKAQPDPEMPVRKHMPLSFWARNAAWLCVLAPKREKKKRKRKKDRKKKKITGKERVLFSE